MSPFRPNGHLPNVQKTKETDIMIATLALKRANAINLSMTRHNNDDIPNVEMDFFVWSWPRLWSTNCAPYARAAREERHSSFSLLLPTGDADKTF